MTLNSGKVAPGSPDSSEKSPFAGENVARQELRNAALEKDAATKAKVLQRIFLRHQALGQEKMRELLGEVLKEMAEKRVQQEQKKVRDDTGDVLANVEEPGEEPAASENVRNVESPETLQKPSTVELREIAESKDAKEIFSKLEQGKGYVFRTNAEGKKVKQYIKLVSRESEDGKYTFETPDGKRILLPVRTGLRKWEKLNTAFKKGEKILMRINGTWKECAYQNPIKDGAYHVIHVFDNNKESHDEEFPDELLRQCRGNAIQQGHLRSTNERVALSYDDPMDVKKFAKTTETVAPPKVPAAPKPQPNAAAAAPAPAPELPVKAPAQPGAATAEKFESATQEEEKPAETKGATQTAPSLAEKFNALPDAEKKELADKAGITQDQLQEAAKVLGQRFAQIPAAPAAAPGAQAAAPATAPKEPGRVRKFLGKVWGWMKKLWPFKGKKNAAEEEAEEEQGKGEEEEPEASAAASKIKTSTKQPAQKPAEEKNNYGSSPPDAVPADKNIIKEANGSLDYIRKYWIQWKKGTKLNIADHRMTLNGQPRQGITGTIQEINEDSLVLTNCHLYGDPNPYGKNMRIYRASKHEPKKETQTQREATVPGQLQTNPKTTVPTKPQQPTRTAAPERDRATKERNRSESDVRLTGALTEAVVRQSAGKRLQIQRTTGEVIIGESTSILTLRDGNKQVKLARCRVWKPKTKKWEDTGDIILPLENSAGTQPEAPKTTIATPKSDVQEKKEKESISGDIKKNMKNKGYQVLVSDSHVPIEIRGAKFAVVGHKGKGDNAMVFCLSEAGDTEERKASETLPKDSPLLRFLNRQ